MHKQNACISLNLNIILKDLGISMKDVNDQEDFYHLASCSIRLYVLAQTYDQCGNSAFQKSANEKRIHFHASMLDVNELKKGQYFKNI